MKSVPIFKKGEEGEALWENKGRRIFRVEEPFVSQRDKTVSEGAITVSERKAGVEFSSLKSRPHSRWYGHTKTYYINYRLAIN